MEEWCQVNKGIWSNQKRIQKTWDVRQNKSENHHSEQWRVMTQMRAGSTTGVNESTGLRCACHSCDWPSCPPACGVMKGAHQHERAKGARWGGWAHRTGVGVAAGVPSPPPGDYTWHDRTGSKVTHGATTHAQGNRHLVQSSSGPQDGQTSWWARERAPHAVTGWLTHPLRYHHQQGLQSQLKLVIIYTTTGDLKANRTEGCN